MLRPTLLVTRPIERAGKTIARLHQEGYAVVHAPLLTIVPVTTDFPVSSQPYNAVIVTSAYALGALSSPPSSLTALLHLPCYTVGDATAIAARAFGFSNVISADSNSQGLAALLAQQQPARSTLLHIAGKDVRDEGLTNLQHQKITILRWVTYSADLAPCWEEDVIKTVQKSRPLTILLYSPRTAAHFMTLLQHHNLIEYTPELCCIGISQAVLPPLSNHRWQSLTSALHPTDNSVIETVLRLSASA